MKCKKKIGDTVILKSGKRHEVIGYSKFFGDNYYKIKTKTGEGIIHVSEIKGCKDERPINTKSLREMVMRRGV